MKVKIIGTIALALILSLMFASIALAVSQATIDAIIADAQDGKVDGNWTSAEIAAALDYIKNNPDVFPADKIADFMTFVEPEQIPEFTELLYQKGYSEQVISGILGGNFLRVAKETWK